MLIGGVPVAMVYVSCCACDVYVGVQAERDSNRRIFDADDSVVVAEMSPLFLADPNKKSPATGTSTLQLQASVEVLLSDSKPPDSVCRFAASSSP